MRGSGGDYQRAKRLRKLSKLLTSPEAQKTAATLEVMLRDVLFGSNRNKLAMPPTDEQQLLFLSTAGGIVVKQLSRQYNSSLWDLSQRFLVAGRLVASKAATPTGSALANYTEVTFMSNNKDSLANGLLQNLGDQIHVSKLQRRQQTKDIIIFLTCEAGGLIPLCCLVLYILLTLVDRARLRLFNVFLAVPRPVAMQLATKEVQVSQEDDLEGDEHDGVAWLRQQQQQQQEQQPNEQAHGGSRLGFNLAAKRKLRTSGLASYVMLAPIALWLAATYPLVQTYANGLLYGSSTLGLDGALKAGNKHEQLWFGDGCININASECLTTDDPMYEVTTDGLNNLVNMFVLHCAKLAYTPPAAVSGNNPSFQFMWNVAREGQSLEVVAMVVGVILVVYFHFYLLVPFLRRVKKETRRVAELLSQLPSEVDVGQLVLDSTDVQQEEDRHHHHHHHKQGTPNAGLVGALGRLLGSCWGRGKAWVSPAAHHASGSEAAKLSIVVSQNTSKDKEAVSPHPGAHDVSRKVKAYKEQMHRHHSAGDGDRDDPSVWDSHRTPRRVGFM
ncbi:hypothetical protein N2152v2_000173 [Parachlorella kessleri]